MSTLITIGILLVSILLVQVFVLEPIQWLSWLHLPRSVGLVLALLLVSWCVGE